MHPSFRDEQGFTLIELLVVILIIGILAAIAIPAFLGQQQKGQDTRAKSDARNAVTLVESCYTETTDYSKCATAAVLSAGGMGGVTPSAVSETAYTVSATSKSGGVFSVTQGASGLARTCTGSTAGCPSSGSW